MIKWGEYQHDGVIYEGFLPEHEGEPQEWLHRVSRNGHILEERRIRLNWRPRFGPDNGDVAALETELDAAMVRVQGHAVPEDAGPYVPQACEISASGPEIHAVFHYLVEEFKQATAALGITIEQSIAFLGLPAGTGPDGLYPFAITPKRDSRMRRVTALAESVERGETIDPDHFHRAKDELDRESVRMHEVAITESLRKEGPIG